MSDIVKALRRMNLKTGDEAADEIERLRGELAATEAKIDALMLEYCHDEMTEEQVQRWANNQRMLSDEEVAAIDSAIKEKQP